MPIVVNSTWNRLPLSVANRSYAAAITSDGKYVANAWGNRIAIHHVSTGRRIGYLSDPGVVKMGIYGDEPVAHLDLVRRLVMDPTDTLLASGGFRTVKLWRRPRDVRNWRPAGFGARTSSTLYSRQ